MDAPRTGRTQGSGSKLALVWLLASWLPAAPCAAQGIARKPLTQEERARLTSGELVARPVKEERDGLRLIGGSAWQVIAASPEVVFRALGDTPRYAQLIPGVSRAVLVSEEANLRRVRIEHKRGPLGTAYRIALQADSARREITFKLNDPLQSGVRAAWGFLSVRPYGPGKSLLSYGVMADPGDGLIVGLVRGVIHDWLLKLPAQTRKFVESAAGRALYGGGAASGASRAWSCVQLDGGQTQQCTP